MENIARDFILQAIKEGIEEAPLVYAERLEQRLAFDVQLQEAEGNVADILEEQITDEYLLYFDINESTGEIHFNGTLFLEATPAQLARQHSKEFENNVANAGAEAIRRGADWVSRGIDYNLDNYSALINAGINGSSAAGNYIYKTGSDLVNNATDYMDNNNANAQAQRSMRSGQAPFKPETSSGDGSNYVARKNVNSEDTNFTPISFDTKLKYETPPDRESSFGLEYKPKYEIGSDGKPIENKHGGRVTSPEERTPFNLKSHLSQNAGNYAVGIGVAALAGAGIYGLYKYLNSPKKIQTAIQKSQARLVTAKKANDQKTAIKMEKKLKILNAKMDILRKKGKV